MFEAEFKKLKELPDEEEGLQENSNRFRRLKKALFGDPTGKIRTFAIVSPENPLGFKNSNEEEFKKRFLDYTNNKKLYNEKNLKDLKSELLKDRIKKTGDTALGYGGFDYIPIKGSYESKEHSLMILNLTYEDAQAVARSYGQESFFFAKVSKDPNKEPSTIAYYRTFNNCKSYKLVEISRTVTDESQAKDFFSKYGLKFRINMQEFGDAVTPIINDGFFEESFTRPTFVSRGNARRSARLDLDESDR